MNNTLTLLLGVINHYPEDAINYRIADYLLHHIGDISHLSTAFLAKECHVSKSAISRFCKTIGLEDFLDLQMTMRTAEYHQESALVYSPDQYLEDIKDHVGKLQQINIDSLADDLHHYDSIYVMGHMQSHLPAYNLQYALCQTGKLVRCYDKIQDQKNILLHACEKDLIIIFTASGQFLERLFVRTARFQQCPARIYIISCVTCDHKPDFVYQWLTLPYGHHQSVAALLFMAFSQLIFFQYEKRCDRFNN